MHGNGKLLAPTTSTRPSRAPPARRRLRRRAISSSGRNSCASSPTPTEADNSLEGRLYNEYALGSRIQYQVRVGEQVFIVEKLRQQAYQRQARRRGAHRLGRRDSILVRRLMAALQRHRRDGTGRRAHALPLAPVARRRLCRAAPRGHRLQLHAAAHLRPLAGADARELRRRSSPSTSYISFLWSLALAALTVILLALICYPVAYGLARVFGRWSTAADAALHHPALRLGERPPLWLGAVLHQERRAARHA